MEQKAQFVFTGEEFASLFCRYGDHFCAPYLSPYAREQGKRKLIKSAQNKEEQAADVRLEWEAASDVLRLRLELNADLVEKTPEGYRLSYLSPAEGEHPLLRAKAFLTSAVLCRRRNLTHLTLRRCAYDPHTRRLSHTYERIDAKQLEEYLSERVADALAFLPLTLPQEGNLRFPYGSLREGQRELMDECYGCLKEKRTLFACAPTGVGKTLSFLYPALKAVEKGRAKRVLFLTSKGSTQRQIQEAAQGLEKKGGDARSILLFARQGRCAHQGRCLREECSRSAGHEERLLPALRALFSRHVHMDPENVSRVAGEYAVCPFELSLLAARFCRVIIGDYNFVYDEKARLRELCDGEGVVLVDEAHNLPDRVRESRSYRLNGELIRSIREHFPNEAEDLLGQAEALLMQGRRLVDDGGETMEHQAPAEAKELCQKLYARLRPRWDGKNPPQGEVIYGLRGFLRACDNFDRGYVCAREEDGSLLLYLADPSHFLQESAAAFGVPVYFSATLLPREYFFSVLGGTGRDRFYQGESPFDPARLLLCAAPLATALANRGDSLRALCRYVAAACQRPGRYLMFFPSFEYLARVQSALRAFCPSLSTIAQQATMSYPSRRDFLSRMEQGEEGRGLLGLCVLGGLFSEGIELKEHSLDGIIVVGTGMAPPSAEREAQCAYYDRREENGKMFSYLLPGFHKVLQAVGRLIRKEEDRGFALLCDRRYADGSYAALYPAHWNEPVLCPDPAHLRQILQRFWQGE